MPPRSTARRLAIVFALALIAPLAVLQTAGAQAAPQAAPASQAVTFSQGAAAQTAPAQAAPTRAAPTQAAPTQTAPPQATPSQAAPPSRQVAPSQAALPQAGNAPVSGGPAYDIEIVIFRANVALGQPENWAAETTTGGTVAGGEAASGSGPVGKLLTVLPSSDYRLTYLASKLRSSGTYLPVAHAAWVQSASAWGTHAGFPLQSFGINVPGLTGVVFLERGQFLHLGMTLSYTMQDPPPGLNASPNTTFVMNETRRVRFYQRNYFDHPAFGVIALVTPARGSRPPGR